MAIVATITGREFTKDMYQRLRQGVDWDGERIDGWLAHSVYFDQYGGIHMTNMWVSIEHMQDAFATRLGPVMRKIGIPPPHVDVHETFNMSVFQTTD